MALVADGAALGDMNEVHLEMEAGWGWCWLEKTLAGDAVSYGWHWFGIELVGNGTALGDVTWS
jgi:hypothetical protein